MCIDQEHLEVITNKEHLLCLCHNILGPIKRPVNHVGGLLAVLRGLVGCAVLTGPIVDTWPKLGQSHSLSWKVGIGIQT